ncbi:MAG: nodulation protein NfeD [Opitutales bacterium]
MMQPPITKAITRWTGLCSRTIRAVFSTQAGPSLCGRGTFGLLVLLCALQNPLIAQGETSGEPGEAAAPAVLLEIDGPIGPAVDDYLGRAFERAEGLEAAVIIIRMDTPGGLDTSMRAIIRKILDSPVPVAVYIAPEGARGASAGTYILYAAHVAAMAPATSVGAATPVQMGGAPGGEFVQADEAAAENATKQNEEAEAEADGDSADDRSADSSSKAMRRKVVNDAVSYLRGLAELRERNEDWAEAAVRQGETLTSSEALEKNVINFRVADVDALLAAMDGFTVDVDDQERTLTTEGLSVQRIEPDWRTKVLSVITNPNVAYILMLLGIYGIILEFSNPGSLVPGISGAICLLLALFALHLLPVNYAGVALILLGILLMLAEAFAPSFGALGIGGIVAFLLGSILLIDTDAPGFELHMPVIIGVTLASALMFIVVFALAVKAWRRPVVSGSEGIVGSEAVALGDFSESGRVRLKGESWRARTRAPLRQGERAKVTHIDGLTVSVEPLKPKQAEKKNHE